MAYTLSDDLIERMSPPKKGSRVYYDTEVRGFGVRVTANGVRSFIFNYRTKDGRERRYTIGRASPYEWDTQAARIHAGELKTLVARGGDPLSELPSAETTSDTNEEDTMEASYPLYEGSIPLDGDIAIRGEDLAAEWHCTKRTLWRYRHLPDGLPCLTISGRTYYPLNACRHWLARRITHPNPTRKR